MTGAEIIPVAKAVQKALADDPSTKNQLAEIAKDTPAMKAAGDAYAKRMVVKQTALLKVYKPLAKWVGVSKDYFENDFFSDMAKMTDDIPEEHLTAPKASVAAPAMEALGYSLDEPELKEMYLNLLATATDKRIADRAHPSFAQIIRQLSAKEAGLLQNLLRREVIPIATIQEDLVSPQTGYRVLKTNVLNLLNRAGVPVVEADAPVWIDNWVRLGLVDVDYQVHQTAEGAYDWVKMRPEFEACKLIPGVIPENVHHNNGIFRRRDFGTEFMKTVFSEHA